MPRLVARHSHPWTFQINERRRGPALKNLREQRGILTAATPLHPLRQAFLNPDWRVTARLLPDKTVRELMLQHARQLRSHATQSLHGNANASVVQRAHPARRARDVPKRLLRVKHHANGIRRRVIQFRFDRRKMRFERAQNIARQRWLRRTAEAHFSAIESELNYTPPDSI